MCQQFFLPADLFGHFLGAMLNLSAKNTEKGWLYNGLAEKIYCTPPRPVTELKKTTLCVASRHRVPGCFCINWLQPQG
jgi:hypothetical protein